MPQIFIDQSQQLFRALEDLNLWSQILILVGVFAIAAWANQRIQALLESRNTGSTGMHHVAVRSAQPVVWPLTALILLMPARAILFRDQLPVTVVEIAVPVFTALAVIRLSIYILRKAFTSNRCPGGLTATQISLKCLFLYQNRQGMLALP